MLTEGGGVNSGLTKKTGEPPSQGLGSHTGMRGLEGDEQAVFFPPRGPQRSNLNRIDKNAENTDTTAHLGQICLDGKDGADGRVLRELGNLQVASDSRRIGD